MNFVLGYAVGFFIGVLISELNKWLQRRKENYKTYEMCVTHGIEAIYKGMNPEFFQRGICVACMDNMLENGMVAER